MPLVLAVLLAATVAAPTAEIVVPVPVRVETAIPPEVLQDAFDEVDAIFSEGGIRLVWNLDPGAVMRSSAVTVNVARRPPEFVVYGCSRDVHDHRLGHTLLSTKRVTLWTDQVTRAVDGNWDRKDLPTVDDERFSRALGRVLAHELGHLFLRLYGHRPDGLMRKAFPHRALTSRSGKGFRFSNLDLERLRASLERYSKPARTAPDG